MLKGTLYTVAKSSLDLNYYRLIEVSFMGEHRQVIPDLAVDVCQLDWKLQYRILDASWPGQ